MYPEKAQCSCWTACYTKTVFLYKIKHICHKCTISFNTRNKVLNINMCCRVCNVPIKDVVFLLRYTVWFSRSNFNLKEIVFIGTNVLFSTKKHIYLSIYIYLSICMYYYIYICLYESILYTYMYVWLLYDFYRCCSAPLHPTKVVRAPLRGCPRWRKSSRPPATVRPRREPASIDVGVSWKWGLPGLVNHRKTIGKP